MIAIKPAFCLLHGKDLSARFAAARAVAKSDPVLSDEILQAVHSVLVHVAKGL
jgi:hypothetical protein